MSRPSPSTTAWLGRGARGLSLRTLLLVLPLASGAGLLIFITSKVSLPLAILALGVIGAGCWLVACRFLVSSKRAELRRRISYGVKAGAVATLGYDGARYGLVALLGFSFKPFHVIPLFGQLFLGVHAPVPATIAVGLAYHLVNGITFGVAYSLFFRRPGLLTGVLWGIGLELCMALLYPRWLRIVALSEFLQVSAFGHVIYGAILGAVTKHQIAKREPDSDA